jgi:hypothetical protein
LLVKLQQGIGADASGSVGGCGKILKMHKNQLTFFETAKIIDQPDLRKVPAKKSANACAIQTEHNVKPSPRQRLRAVADGKAQLNRADIESLVTSSILDADNRSRTLSARCADLLEMVFDPEFREGIDVNAALDLVARLDRLQRGQMAEARRGLALLARISAAQRPCVTVVAANHQEVNGPIYLGGKVEDC